MSFHFPLQRLLELRRQRERAMAEEVARATAVADAERQTRDALATAHAHAQSRVSGTTDTTVGQIVSMQFALAQMGEQLGAADDRARAAEVARSERQEALTRAAQDRQVLDRLRERRTEEFRLATSSEERRTMDAIALERHARGDDNAPHSEDSTR